MVKRTGWRICYYLFIVF